MSLLLLVKSYQGLKTVRLAPEDLSATYTTDNELSFPLIELKKRLLPLGCDPDDWGVQINRRTVFDDEVIVTDTEFLDVSLYGKLRGGKGGFGTLLRGKGSRGPKTNNFESSRDLEGRRLRTARAPERMRQWVERKVQEHEIIKAVGGEDPFLGKKICARDVMRLYHLSVSADSYDPFEQVEEDDTQQQLREQAVMKAASALTAVESNTDLAPARDGLYEGKEDYLNSYLDDIDDI